MTYAELIHDIIFSGGKMLFALLIALFALSLIIMIVIKWLILPRVKKFIALIDSLVSRVEVNEKQLTNVNHEIDLIKQDFKNTRDLVANIAEISTYHISEMKLMVNDLQETVKEVRDTVLIMAHEHKKNHNEKNNHSSFTFDKPNKHKPKSGCVE